MWHKMTGGTTSNTDRHVQEDHVAAEHDLVLVHSIRRSVITFDGHVIASTTRGKCGKIDV